HESRYFQMFELNQAIKLLINPTDGAIIQANQAACQFYGYSLAEIVQKKIMDINILHPEQVKQEMENAQAAQRLYFNFRHRLASGEIRDVMVYSGPVSLRGQKLLYSIIYDVTDKARVEKELQAAYYLLEQRVEERTAELLKANDLLNKENIERRRAEEALKESEDLFKSVFSQSPIGIELFDTAGCLVDVNQSSLDIFGLVDKREIGGFSLLDDPNLSREIKEKFQKGEIIRKEVEFDFDLVKTYNLYRTTKSGRRLMNLIMTPLQTNNEIRGYLVLIEDITERKRAEREREELICELQRTLAEVRTLRGFIPICASCKKIRDDQGFWQQIEQYIQDHSDAHFSHGICPDCAKQLYPEYYRKIKVNV
ncbi:MAG: PAS domain S-box protein, partial [Deltaproteobacteria bacterium]|nr:PAS domain S-box protein [Deltaproteobacteria bacterium]